MRHIRILLAEDDPLMAELVEQQLALRGYEAVRVSSGSEALRCLEDEEGYDAVVSDLHMPAGDGFAVLAGVRARHPELPVVLVTAFPTPETRARAVREGAFAMLSKPFSAEELIGALDRGLGAPAVAGSAG